MKFFRNIIAAVNFRYFLRKKHIAALGSAALLLVFSYAAQAQVASISASVNLRQGPGTQYARIAALPRGAAVHINSCRGGWCEIRSSWGVGWVSGRYLSQGYNSAPSYAPAYNSQPQVYLGLNFGSGFYDDGPYYGPYYRPYYRHWNPPYYRPYYRPWRNSGYRPYGRGGWHPGWGVGPAHFPRGKWRR
ncbi:MAG: SH3 domain-containing protein [Brucellaceae bacterium]|jgi:uncharacterized protein YraI|nr:SH3 domain-containing protein [Brucellaceae bacterium]